MARSDPVEDLLQQIASRVKLRRLPRLVAGDEEDDETTDILDAEGPAKEVVEKR